MVDRLRPLLIQYNVTAYFCGHDHDAQHIHENGSTVEYFVTGAAHKTNALLNNLVRIYFNTGRAWQSSTIIHDPHLNLISLQDSIPPNSLLFSYGVSDPDKIHGAFNWVSIDSNTMNTTFVDDQGT